MGSMAQSLLALQHRAVPGVSLASSLGGSSLGRTAHAPLRTAVNSRARGRVQRVAATMEPTKNQSWQDSMEDGGTISRIIALGSVSAATALFLFTRMAGAETSLTVMASHSIPYDQAMADSRPAMVEFYADWCEVCKEMARDVAKVETRFKDKVNFVMINVDDPRYQDELDEFGVDGIPHFAFLNTTKDEQGFVVGRMPRRILSENLVALANGDAVIPHSQVVGDYSDSAEALGSAPAGSAAALASSSLEAPPLVATSAPATSAANEVAAVADAPAFGTYDFEVENIKGERVPLGEYRGKVTLIVNVASKCGLTDSNYKGLTQLYSKYKDQGFEILAFPCNQFLGQEPGSNAEIENFACSRYKATYPLFAKVDVNGANAAPLYKFLKSQQGGGKAVQWNFEKFLVDKDGNVVKRYDPTFPPMGVEDDLKALL